MKDRLIKNTVIILVDLNMKIKIYNQVCKDVTSKEDLRIFIPHNIHEKVPNIEQTTKTNNFHDQVTKKHKLNTADVHDTNNNRQKLEMKKSEAIKIKNRHLI